MVADKIFTMFDVCSHIADNKASSITKVKLENSQETYFLCEICLENIQKEK